MKYIIRIIALPFWGMCYLIFALFLTLKGFLFMCYDFVVYGGEQITHNHKTNRNSIFEVYKKLEQMELNSRIDPRSHCNHVWEQEYANSTAPRQKCAICGLSVNNNHFTQ